jgi:ATP-dependent Lhr-like helicase
LQEPAATFGFGTAVVAQALERLSARMVKGEFRPGGSGIEWCDSQVLRLIRRRSVAALRKEAEPVPAAALATFLPAWQHVAPSSTKPDLKGAEGVLLAIEQLAGAAIPASAWESLILPARVADYQPGMLDELTLAGEVTWVGAGSLSGGDGWLAMAPMDTASALLPLVDYDADPLEQELLTAVSAGGGWFFHELLERLRMQTPELTSQRLTDALWNLVWAGRITGDSWNPIRAQLAGTSRRAKVAAPRRRARYSAQVRIPTPAQVAGRWSRAVPREEESTLRSAALAQTFLDRYGVVTRGAVSAEGVEGGFSAMYRVLAAMEESGRCQRGYIVEGLGAAQFATSGAVDRLRMLARATPGTTSVVLMAATDPANPYGAALPWPAREESSHRPGRKAGAIVVLVDGELALYVERGGRSLLTWSQDAAVLTAAGSALVTAVRNGQLGKLTVEKGDGESLLTPGSPISAALASAGFIATPRGLRIRA